jgi:hypothetical protein
MVTVLISELKVLKEREKEFETLEIYFFGFVEVFPKV